MTTIRIPKDARLLRQGAVFLLSAVLTAVLTPGGCAPFALGFLAAAGTGRDTAAALGGTVLGSFLFLDFVQALPHLAAAVLIFTASAAFRGTAILTRRRINAALAAALFAAVGGIYVVQSLTPWQDLPLCLGATALTAASAYLFWPLLRREGEMRDGALLLAAAILLAFEEVEVLGCSFSRCLLALLVLYTAVDLGSAAGTAAGLGLGIMADICCGAQVFTAAFGLGALAAASQSGKRRIRASAAFFAAVCAALLHSTDSLAWSLLLESAGASAAFLALPGRLFGGKRIQKKPEIPNEEAPLAAVWKRRVEGAAQALRDLYDSLGRGALPPNDENPAIIFDRAAEHVCRDCGLCQLCWQSEYTATFNALNDATPYLVERGRAMAKDFPRHFADRCIHLPDFLAAVNSELSAFLLRRQYRRQLEETRRSARGQYAQLSELLAATAAGLGETAPASAQAAPCRIGAALRPKEGENVCGDTVLSFCTEEGKWCLLLSDGMGSGEAARKESALVCRLLRQFLESGIAAEAALKTLNAAMALRGAESGSFTTVDLCIYDPASSEAVIYKYGAAPSYLKKGGSVRRIAGTSLPVGLRGTPAPPDQTRLPMTPGSFVVLISDGVADSTRDEWIQNLLAGWNGEDPQSLAGLILSESIREMRGQDDCGIQILYCPKEETREV